MIEILREIRSKSFGLKNSQDFVACHKTYLCNTMRVSQDHTWKGSNINSHIIHTNWNMWCQDWDQVTFQVSHLQNTAYFLYIRHQQQNAQAKLTQTSKEGLPNTKENLSGGNCECWKTIIIVSLLDYRPPKKKKNQGVVKTAPSDYPTVSLSLHIYTHTHLWLCITSPLDHKLKRRLCCFFTITVFSGSGITQLANICRTKPFAQSHTQLRFKPHLLESNEHSEQPVPASLTSVWSEACLYSCNVPQLPQLQ